MIRYLPLALMLASTSSLSMAADPDFHEGHSLHIRLPDQTHFYRPGGDIDIDPICSTGSKYEFDAVAKVIRYICISPEHLVLLPVEARLHEAVFPESKGWRLHVHELADYWIGHVPHRAIEYRDCNFAAPPVTNPDGTSIIPGGVREAWNCARIGFPIIMFDSGFE